MGMGHHSYGPSMVSIATKLTPEQNRAVLVYSYHKPFVNQIVKFGEGQLLV
jgi:hypothetical protein